jgi:hypothetical protein
LATACWSVPLPFALANKLSAAVELLHVFELPSRMTGMEAVALARDDSEMIALARVRLERLDQRESDSDLRVTAQIKPTYQDPCREVLI